MIFCKFVQCLSDCLTICTWMSSEYFVYLGNMCGQLNIYVRVTTLQRTVFPSHLPPGVFNLIDKTAGLGLGDGTVFGGRSRSGSSFISSLLWRVGVGGKNPGLEICSAIVTHITFFFFLRTDYLFGISLIGDFRHLLWPYA